MRVSGVRLAGVAALGALLLGGCSVGSAAPSGTLGSSARGGATATTLDLVAFSVPKAADGALEAAWAKTPDGEGVTWTESYGASGDQSRAVASGLHADFVHFSLESDVTRLVDAGLVAEDWNAGPTAGIVSCSVVVLVVRPGNPKNIAGWDDLIKDGVQVITPNPGSSGSARWNILAAWGSAIADGGTEAEAETYISNLFRNVVALPGSSRDATSAFLSGTGDVLVSYENEAILAKQNGEALDYVVPDITLRIDNPGAVLMGAKPQAEAWLDYILSPAGQAIYAQFGFRPVIDGVAIGSVNGANDPKNPFPAPEQLLTIADFGGWPTASAKFFDPDTGIISKIQVATGKSS